MKIFLCKIIATMLLTFATLALAIFTILLPFFYLYRKVTGKYPPGITINGEH